MNCASAERTHPPAAAPTPSAFGDELRLHTTAPELESSRFVHSHFRFNSPSVSLFFFLPFCFPCDERDLAVWLFPTVDAAVFVRNDPSLFYAPFFFFKALGDYGEYGRTHRLQTACPTWCRSGRNGPVRFLMSGFASGTHRSIKRSKHQLSASIGLHKVLLSHDTGRQKDPYVSPVQRRARCFRWKRFSAVALTQ